MYQLPSLDYDGLVELIPSPDYTSFEVNFHPNNSSVPSSNFVYPMKDFFQIIEIDMAPHFKGVDWAQLRANMYRSISQKVIEIGRLDPIPIEFKFCADCNTSKIKEKLYPISGNQSVGIEKYGVTWYENFGSRPPRIIAQQCLVDFYFRGPIEPLRNPQLKTEIIDQILSIAPSDKHIGMLTPFTMVNDTLVPNHFWEFDVTNGRKSGKNICLKEGKVVFKEWRDYSKEKVTNISFERFLNNPRIKEMIPEKYRLLITEALEKAVLEEQKV